ncbi:MAG: ectoine/hydroxyectoine ABC transporter substrate-binding protein EhuB [Devosia sp.]
MINTHFTGKTILAALTIVAMASTAVSAATLAEIKEKGTIRIAVANEIPYGYIDPNGQAMGAAPDVAKYVMEKLGIDNIEWVTAEFSGLIPGLQADRFDMVAAEMAILPARCEQVIYSEPNTSYGEGLLVAAGNPGNIHGFGDFAERKDIKVAIMAGADQLDMLQALGVAEDQIVTISSNADAISTVSTGRADAYAATSLTSSELAAKGDKVETAADFVDPIVNGVPVRSWGGFTFAKGSEELRDAVNEVLVPFKGTDEWRKTIMDYGFSQADADGSLKMTTAELCTPK